MKKFYILLIVLTGLTACTTQQVQVDYDRNINFYSLKTYSINEDSIQLDELDKERFLSILKKQLSQKNLLYSENADIQIQIYPKEYVSKNSNSSVGVGVGGGNYGYRGGFGGGVSFGIPISSKKLNQDFTVQFWQNNQLIWEGILAIQMPYNASPETRDVAMEKGIQKLLKNYPPKTK
ncbi:MULTISPECIES: DUF4136 domain-containing protein [Weeksella]|uniref:DUF4136 domain-containing protein n=1 Tax=Weeksella TaxID=1013 RepID=UPI0008A26D5B|nr:MULTISPECIES: DUF4136 domain-containing protein [Weeksella]MDK7675761.1 DUF4136 domain-containing protein [Weeksella virosa]OFM82167.1 hypothetical protein HMPREF2660_04795 [Weeksella sp. HMSC059D05]